jgi:hypothetical protein
VADEVLREPTPLLTEEGIHVNNIDVPTWTRCSRRSAARSSGTNMAMFTPAEQAHEPTAVTMRLAAEAIADGDTKLAAAILDQAQPESPDDSAATATGCTGLALGMLDQWLSGQHQRTRRAGQADPAARRTLDRRARRVCARITAKWSLARIGCPHEPDSRGNSHGTDPLDGRSRLRPVA